MLQFKTTEHAFPSSIIPKSMLDNMRKNGNFYDLK